MGDDERPPIDDRNAANRARFEQLPAAGSPAYWAKLEDSEKATRLDLEILVMCARERLAAGRREEAERIFGILWDRAQREVRRQIEGAVFNGARDRGRIIEDIMQECISALWLDIAGVEETFLTRGFWRKMRFMVANAISQRLIAEGVRTRAGTIKSERVPQGQTDSLDQPVGPDEDYSRGDSLADPRAEEPFSQVEFVADMTELLKNLTADQRQLLRNAITGDMTQAELGKLLGITDRAVRMRLVALQAWLRRRYDSPDPSGASGEGAGGATGGEEGQ